MRSKIFVLCSGFLVLFLLGSAKATEPKVLLESKVATDGDFLTLPVEIDGKQYSFIVDTGSSSTALDKSFLDSLDKYGESETTTEVADGVSSKRYHAPSISVLGTERGKLPFSSDSFVWCFDMSHIRETSDQPINGILGMDFLATYALELDLSVGTLRLLDSETLAGIQHDGTLQTKTIDHRPCIWAQSHDLKFLALIDTGALITIDLQRECYVRLYEQDQLWPWAIKSEKNGRKQITTARMGWLNSLKVGPFSHNGLHVAGIDDQITVLGIAYWKRYHATFDFPHKLVYLNKGPLYDMFDESGHSGIFVDSAKGSAQGKTVTRIVKGCFAEQNGIQVGDQVLSINGESVVDSSKHDIYRRLSDRADHECKLRLVRDGKEFTVTLPKVGKMSQLEDPK